MDGKDSLTQTMEIVDAFTSQRDWDQFHTVKNLISSISKKRANALIKKGVIGSGMVPKVKCIINALSEGVNKAHIIDGRISHSLVLETFTDSGIGTEILL